MSDDEILHSQIDTPEKRERVLRDVIEALNAANARLTSELAAERAKLAQRDEDMYCRDERDAARAELKALQARTDALVAGLKNAPGRLPGYIQEPLDAIVEARK